MRRGLVSMAVGGVWLAFACNDVPNLATAPRGPSVASGSSGRAVSPPPFQRVEPAAVHACNSSQTSCGKGCCAYGYICLLDVCIAPGLECERDSDCTAERYCEPTFGRCLPRPALCDSVDAGPFEPRCLEPSCAPDKSALVIAGIAQWPCDCGQINGNGSSSLGIRVQNRGRTTVPAGAQVNVWGSTATDASRDILTLQTSIPLVPGQSTDVYVSVAHCDYSMTLVSRPDDCNLDIAPRGMHSECEASE